MAVFVYPDTNALWGDPFLTGTTGKRLRDAISSTDARLHLSPVVVSELRNRVRDEIASMRSAVSGSASGARRLGLSTDAVHVAVEDLASKMSSSGERLIEELLESPGVVLDAHPGVSSEGLSERAIDRRRPFLRDGRGVTSGHNDVLIWEGLKDLLRDTDAIVVLVSRDSAFRGRGGKLHGDLRSELANDGLDPNRAILADSVHRALSEYIQRPDRERNEAFLDLMCGYTMDWPNFGFGWFRNRHTGELEEGDYVLDIDQRIQSVRLLNIVNLGNGYVGPSEPALVSLEVRLDFEGWVYNSDWPELHESTAERWIAQLNSGATTIGFSRCLRMTARGTWDSASREAYFDDETIQIDVIAGP